MLIINDRPTAPPPVIITPPTGGTTSAGLRTSTSLIGGGQMPQAQIPTPTKTANPSTFASVAASAAINDIIGLVPGTYTNVSVAPKNNQTWVGLGPGVVLDPNYSLATAFADGNNVTTNVTIANMSLARYTCGLTSSFVSNSSNTSPGCIVPNNQLPGFHGQSTPPWIATPSKNWTLNYVTITYARGSGYEYCDNMQVLNSKSNYNAINGYKAAGSFTLADNCEFAWNGTPGAVAVTGSRNGDFGNEGGAGKRVLSRGCVITHCEPHHNQANGLWDDFANDNMTFTWNYVHHHPNNGIMHEISYGATVTDNQIDYCGISFTDPTTGTVVIGRDRGGNADQGAAVYYSDSNASGASGLSNITSVIKRNRGTGNWNSTQLRQDNRSPHLNGPLIIGGSVDDANIWTGCGGFGWYQSQASPAATGIVSDYNQYLNTNHGYASTISWNGHNNLTFAQLQALGVELHGTYS